MEDFSNFLKDKLGEHVPEEVIQLKYIIQFFNKIQVEELILDKLLTTNEFNLEQKLVFEKYNTLYRLSLNNIGLISLQNFPKLKELQIVRKIFVKLIQLELNDNKLDGSDFNIIIKQCPSVRKLKIENNNITDIKNINNLLGLNIKKINICGNPFIKDNPDYKNKLFEIFLSLISIDGTDKEGNDIESTEYENSQNILEKIENSSIDENIDKSENKENVVILNDSKSIEENAYEILDDDDEEEDLEEEEDDSIDENIDNNLNK